MYNCFFPCAFMLADGGWHMDLLPKFNLSDVMTYDFYFIFVAFLFLFFKDNFIYLHALQSS